MLAPLCAALALALALAAPVRAPSSGRSRAARPVASPAASSLASARALLEAVKRDPVRRRHRDAWERAILAMEAAAKGSQRAPALLEAARARYALYRFSQVESDRAAALRLAAEARAAGAKEAGALAAAIRKEMAGKSPARPKAPSTPSLPRFATPLPPALPRPEPSAGAEEDEEGSMDPVLERALAGEADDGAAAGEAAPPAARTGKGVETADAAEEDDDGGEGAAVLRSRGLGAELPARRPVRRVVVDAGHGGHDTGAIGPSGVREKDVTLAMARRLSRQLRARGFEVVLTRDRDAYLALAERSAAANARKGDLLVSLHANAHPRRDQRGVETYVLNVADDRYAARLAARENGALVRSRRPGGGGAVVRHILADLEAKSSAEASRKLAVLVQREVCTGVREKVGEVRDLGVKSALFHVLLGARMPAVLVETSFISNREDERRLASSRFQEEVAASIARAVSRFAEREARDARVALAR